MDVVAQKVMSSSGKIWASHISCISDVQEYLTALTYMLYELMYLPSALNAGVRAGTFLVWVDT